MKRIIVLGIVAVIAACILVPIASAAYIQGTSGPDSITGTKEADLIRSYAGKDSVNPARGDDVVLLSSGNDSAVLVGPEGQRWGVDNVRCGPGFDRVLIGDEDTAALNCEVVLHVG